VKLAVKVEARLFPAPLNGTFYDVLQCGDFAEGQAAKEFQIDYVGEFGFDLLQMIKHIAENRKLPGVGAGLVDLRRESSDLEAVPALERTTIARMIDNQSTHYPSHVPKKTWMVWEIDIRSPGQADIGFVQQCGDADRGRGSLSGQLALRHAVKLRVQGAEQ
jgi:hypothetical protein